MDEEATKMDNSNKKRFSVPDTYVIIFCVILLAAFLTYVIPVGQFDTHDVTFTQEDGTEKTRNVLIPESFEIAKDDQGQSVKNGIKFFEPGGEVGIMNYMFEGLVSGDKWGSAVGVVAFILVIGGAFGIILKTGAVESGMLYIIKRTKGFEIAVLPILFFIFSLGGAVFGMGEEAIPFVMILVPIIIAMGYDAITCILVTYVATQIGFATSWMNPFSVAVAQGVAGIPVMSAATFRIFMWILFTTLGIVYTMLYAKKIKKDPLKSISYEEDAHYREEFEGKANIEVDFGLGHGLVILTIILGMAWVVWGVMKYEYYIPEIATQFFIMGIVSGIIAIIFKLNNMTVNDMASSFREGAKDLLGAGLVVAMAKGIILVLGGADPTTPTVLNTVLHYTGNIVGMLPPALAAWFMLVFQSVFNFFVVSGSGQAALTMPLMAPLSDLVGVSRQVAVLAFQLGDGFTNLIVPTSGILMAVLGITKIEWSKWAKWQLKFQGILFLFASIIVIVATMIGLQ
ncbi:putative basic amino acid antiporter YfcC [Anaerophilus nitritogenes]|uniref:putative basic amino acid antiporter YfcC n=1 Tax=Anaerophilus nitritogenes TaxID=2498136 RepID=UPI001FAAF751|nr:putative basic amino acid antiporter YfcC [Anaerophilus nitritogenes]